VTDPVVFVADAGPEAGLGHISRSSAIAVALRCRGIEGKCFALGAHEPFERDGVAWLPLTDEDVGTSGASVLVVDSYRLATERLARAASSRLVIMHDEGRPPSGAAVVVTAAGEGSSDGATWLAGPAYAALRPGFWGMPARTVRDTVQRVLITTGSAHFDDLSLTLAQALTDALPDARVTIVRGPFATRAAPAGVDTANAPESLLELLLASDLVISGAGQTMLEAAAAGTPCVALALVENQRLQAELLARLGAVELFSSPDATATAAAAVALAGDAQARRRLSTAAQQAVDGYGALRVAFEIARLASSAS
jgi:UDP-2,4-diacetamido-2,4,6-trideoxy-beta-L-altropyranose hydrolase